MTGGVSATHRHEQSSDLQVTVCGATDTQRQLETFADTKGDAADIERQLRRQVQVARAVKSNLGDFADVAMKRPVKSIWCGFYETFTPNTSIYKFTNYPSLPQT
ncbi:hypothetical protein ElyMa_006521200 [Elysia marginata]|uniref:Uncharacterized protein n=1 Tax=Elysia marginata TaxID=1093978 RepID=A0AAV4I616_9GAST|nr:hypothetical protein ElyMa_006521200 [Elysia marginata]